MASLPLELLPEDVTVLPLGGRPALAGRELDANACTLSSGVSTQGSASPLGVALAYTVALSRSTTASGQGAE